MTYLQRFTGEECIPDTWKCDHTVDCHDKSDEDDTLCLAQQKSKKSCANDEFRCVTNGECIPQYWLCDKMVDCIDGSDENETFCSKRNQLKHKSDTRYLYLPYRRYFQQIQAGQFHQNQKTSYRQITLRILVGQHFSSLLIATLNLCPIYFKLLVHVL